ncbi:MAG TPA: hypothetical protein PL125_05900 [Candidatus Omnitrophota bacterium]|nr:hypothetical protein [Candidatus Omnitrophota bacterium]
MKNILRGMIFAVVAFCATSAWAASSQTVTVSATVPTKTGGLSVAISKVTGTVWTANQTAISFGTLIWDTTNKIFLPTSYYAVDIGVEDNSGTAWTVTHTRASLASGTNNINNKVNVSFNKQTSSTVSTELQKVSFGNSNSIAYTKAQLAGGWLRIYYGIGTGEDGKDADGVTPIGLDTPAGTYTGSVTITLTP